MTNIATVLKTEISRLSSKAARQHVEPLQKTAVQLRKQVATLRQSIEALQREIASLKKQAARTGEVSIPSADAKVRFTTKGLRSLRKRLDLSAEDFGHLVGVSAQTIYNWESEKSHPRASQVTAIAALRTIGKKEARARLEQSASASDSDATTAPSGAGRRQPPTAAGAEVQIGA